MINFHHCFQFTGTLLLIGSFLSLNCTAQTVVPVVGYITPINVFFEGEAIGNGVGIVRLMMSTGHKCSGQWRYSSSDRGTAEASCTDERKLKVEFYAQDPYTGTSISKGRTSQGEEVVAYAGLNAVKFMASKPEKPKQKTTSTGTAFFISDRGHLLTNQHVVPGCDRVSVQNGDMRFTATVIASDEHYDLALLKIQAASPRFATVARSIRIGEPVYALGYPLAGYINSDLVFQGGMIAADSGIQGARHQLQHSAPLNPGNSGGPLLNMFGQVAGVNVSVVTAGEAKQVYSQQYYAVNTKSVFDFVGNVADAEGLPVTAKSDMKKLQPEAIFEKAKAFTVKVTCEKNN